MSTVYEVPLATWLVRSPALKMPYYPRGYGYLDSARYEARKTLACRRRTKHYEDLDYTSFSHPNLELVYATHMPRPKQLDNTVVFTAWLLPVDLSLLLPFSDIDQPYVHSEDHFTCKAPVGQETSHDDRSTNRDRDFQDHQDGQTQETHTNTDHTPPYAHTRSHHHNGGSDGGSPPPERRAAVRSFDRYGPPLTAREINEGVRRLLLGHFPTTEGYVYGFTHPDDEMFRMSAEPSTRGTHLIKIGRSVNYERRMREFRRNCKYLPRVVFAHLMPHHFRIELVVHLQLHNVRLRDVGCNGCGARHEEWFGVDVAYAERFVSLWQGFANCHPYDEGGEMLPMWRERLEELDMDDGDCWERFIRGIPSDHPVAGHPQGIEEYPSTPCEDYVGPSSDELSRTDTQ